MGGVNIIIIPRVRNKKRFIGVITSVGYYVSKKIYDRDFRFSGI